MIDGVIYLGKPLPFVGWITYISLAMAFKTFSCNSVLFLFLFYQYLFRKMIFDLFLKGWRVQQLPRGSLSRCQWMERILSENYNISEEEYFECFWTWTVHSALAKVKLYPDGWNSRMSCHNSRDWWWIYCFAFEIYNPHRALRVCLYVDFFMTSDVHDPP